MYPPYWGGRHRFETFLDPVFSLIHKNIPEITEFHPDVGFEYFLMGVSILIAIYGIFIGFRFYNDRKDIPDRIVHRFPKLYQMLNGKYYVDEIYQMTFVMPLKKISYFLAFVWDQLVIDQLVNFFAKSVLQIAQRMRNIQSGVTTHYLFSMLIFTVVFLLAFLFKGV